LREVRGGLEWSESMPQSLPISQSMLPHAELETSNCANLVLNAYTIAMATSRNEPKAFAAAIRAWRERNPKAAQAEAVRAVANIICKKIVGSR
jgi:hypothetical protein